MVFLRPVVIRTQQEATDLTLDRYDSIRALQKDSQPERSRVIPINDAPIIPPLRAPRGAAPPQAPGSPASAPPN